MRILFLILALLGTNILKAQVIPYYSAANDKYGYKDDKGNVVIEPRYDLAYTLDEGMAAVRLNGKYGYVDQKGREVVPPKYATTWKFIGGYAAVKLGDKYGFIDKEGKEVVPIIYQDAYNYHGTCCYKGMAHVKQDGRWKIIPIPPDQNFRLNEIDMHVHAGKERPLPLNEWIELFVRDGRKVLLLLDHMELYRMEDPEREQWIKKKGFPDWYPDTATGKYDFMQEMAAVGNRKDVLTFRGWEIWEGELDEGLEKKPMRDAEVIGWHMSKAAWDGKAPAGKELIFRVRQVADIQKEFPVPMIIFHPFIGHYQQVQEIVKKSGRSLSSIKKEEYRYFTRAQQKDLIELLKERSVYIEISRGWSTLWNDPVVREAFIEDIRPLAKGGVKFTVSTDAHGTGSFKEPFDPGYYCTDLGITTENVNSIIRELLAIRAKKVN